MGTGNATGGLAHTVLSTSSASWTSSADVSASGDAPKSLAIKDTRATARRVAPTTDPLAPIPAALRSHALSAALASTSFAATLGALDAGCSCAWASAAAANASAASTCAPYAPRKNLRNKSTEASKSPPHVLVTKSRGENVFTSDKPRTHVSYAHSLCSHADRACATRCTHPSEDTSFLAATRTFSIRSKDAWRFGAQQTLAPSAMDRALDTSTSVTTCVTGLLSHRLGLRSILRTSNCSRASAAYRLTHPSTKSQLPSELTSASPRLTMRPSAVFPGTLRLDKTSRSSRGARLAIAEAVPASLVALPDDVDRVSE